MIYKLTFEDGRIDWCTAKNQLHLLKEYDKEYDLPLQEIDTIEELTDEEAKATMLTNTDYGEENPDDMPEKISVFDGAVGDDFCIIGSTEWA